MNENYSKNSIISLVLIVSFVLMPLSFIPKKTEASNINTIIGGLSNVITQMPLCKDIGSVKELFSSAQTLLNKKLAPTLVKTIEDASDETESVKVDIGTTVKENIEQGTTSAKETEKVTKALTKNDTCLKSIGRTIIKMLLQKITTDTVSWINGGMNGDPLFVENYEEYFGDIVKYEILGLGTEINNQELYPFGRAFMQAQANSYKNKFANNARYTLNKTIYDTNPEFSAQTFSNDFSQGGWSAWDALTQNPANNPLGFSLMASNELARRIEDKTSIAKGSLQTSGGYLGVQKCVEPEGVTKEEDNKARYGSAEAGPFRKCEQWNFVTPGQMVATAAEKITKYPENNLLKAEDLNDAVAAILDAFLNHYSSSFMSEGGFAGLSESENWNTEGEFIVDYDNTTNYNDPQVGQDFSSFQIGASSFLAQNPNFDIRTDLNQALIDEQRIFVDKLIGQNRELMSTILLTPENNPSGSFTGNYGLIPTIYQLDYCIPGPHPGFEQDSRTVLSAALDTIVPEDTNTLADRDAEEVMGLVKESAALLISAVGMAVGAVIFSEIPVLGTAIGAVVGYVVGYLIGFVLDLLGGDDGEELARMYYNQHMVVLTNTQAKTCKGGQNCKKTDKETAKGTQTLHSKGPFVDALNIILDRYIQVIYAVYKPEKMPSITKEAAGKYLQLKGYGQMFTNNESRIVSMQSIIKRLGEIRDRIEELNQNLKDKKVKKIDGSFVNENDETALLAQYEENLKPWISAFGRISQEMVTGDDIAVVDNTIKQIVDEKDYIYNDLLKGPNGCEKSLELMRGASGINGTGLPWQIYYAKRLLVNPLILYDYNKFTTAGDNLPDPYKSGYENKIAIGWAGFKPNSWKEAMLPNVSFENTEGKWCGDNYKKTGIQNPVTGEDLHAPICLQDLFPLRNYSGWVSDRFEKIIGIY